MELKIKFLMTKLIIESLTSLKRADRVQLLHILPLEVVKKLKKLGK